LPIPGLGRDGGGAAAVAYHDLRDGDGLRRFDERRGGTPGRRSGDEGMTIGCGAAHGAVQRAGGEASGIGRDARDLGKRRR
jgi:hypothetical protein